MRLPLALVLLVACALMVPLRLSAQPAAKGANDPGRAVYTRTCMACHQTNGQGMPPVFPPLAGSERVTAADPSELIRIILHGLTGPIEVKGKRYTGLMPPQGGLLKDADIAAVVTYVRSAWGHTAPAVDEATVKALREKHKDRKSPWTAADLEKARTP